jgi:hypothetical protein
VTKTRPERLIELHNRQQGKMTYEYKKKQEVQEQRKKLIKLYEEIERI